MEKRAKNSQEFFEEEKKKVLTIIGEHSKKKPPGQKKILARTAKNEYGIDKNAMHALFNSVTPVAVPRIDYDNHPAYVSGKLYNVRNNRDPDITIQKLVLADEYTKQKRFDESYVLLGDALEKYSGFKGEKKKEMYESIERRALRYAKIVARRGRNIALAEAYLKLAEKCEQYMNANK